MVKLQKRFAYTYKKKDHYKHIVTIPEDALEKLGWKNVDELELIVRNKELIFHPKDKRENKND